MERWIPIPWDLAKSRDGDRLAGWCYIWTALHEGKTVTRRDVQEITGFGWRKSAGLLEQCKKDSENWTGQQRAKDGPTTGQSEPTISTTCTDERANNGPTTGQERAAIEPLRLPIQIQDTIKTPLDKIKKIWLDLMKISADSATASSRLKLTAWRRTMLTNRLEDYSHEEIVYAWRWWNESLDEQADFLRNNRGAAGIDTFLRRMNHDKYQAFAAEWKQVIEEPGEDASIAEMRAYYNYQNRKLTHG